MKILFILFLISLFSCDVDKPECDEFKVVEISIGKGAYFEYEPGKFIPIEEGTKYIYIQNECDKQGIVKIWSGQKIGDKL